MHKIWNIRLPQRDDGIQKGIGGSIGSPSYDAGISISGGGATEEFLLCRNRPTPKSCLKYIQNSV